MKQVNQLQIFNNEEFGQVKVILNEQGEPEFELYSVGIALGYFKTDGKTMSVQGGQKLYPRKDRIDTVMKNGSITGLAHGEEIYLNEDMLYDFIFEAKTEKARPFRKWVTSDLLPTLRKTGYYSLHNENEENNKEDNELKQIANNIFGELDEKINKLDEYYRPRHKTKLSLNKFIKDCLGDNSTKDNCKKAKETLLTMLGNYSIYEEVPIDKLQDSNTIAILYDICKNINNSIVGGIR